MIPAETNEYRCGFCMPSKPHETTYGRPCDRCVFPVIIHYLSSHVKEENNANEN